MNNFPALVNPEVPLRSFRKGPMIVGAAAMTLALGAVSFAGSDRPEAFDPHRSISKLSTPDADAIRDLVKKDAAACMKGAYQSADLIRTKLRPIIGKTADEVSVVCTPNNATSQNTYTLSVGPENCENINTTTDGEKFLFHVSYGNCESDLPPAVH